LAEVNVKALEFMTSESGILVKKIKPNFKTLGPKFGQQMKVISQGIAQFSAEDINRIEQEGNFSLQIEGSSIQLDLGDVLITTEDIPGWVVTSMNGNTVALDISLTEELISEGLARELINRIQNLRKDQGFEVTDKIKIALSAQEKLASAINNNLNYICSETLADELRISSNESLEKGQEIELTEGVFTRIELLKV
jgi:isoleucyl-tRNA synthetase